MDFSLWPLKRKWNVFGYSFFAVRLSPIAIGFTLYALRFTLLLILHLNISNQKSLKNSYFKFPISCP
jgi:hypothetical protein